MPVATPSVMGHDGNERASARNTTQNSKTADRIKRPSIRSQMVRMETGAGQNGSEIEGVSESGWRRETTGRKPLSTGGSAMAAAA